MEDFSLHIRGDNDRRLPRSASSRLKRVWVYIVIVFVGFVLPGFVGVAFLPRDSHGQVAAAAHAEPGGKLALDYPRTKFVGATPAFQPVVATQAASFYRTP